MSEFSRETLLNIIETDHVQCGEASALARMALAAMDSSESVELPLDYLQGHKDGLEWAAQLAEANHPETGDWLYDDPIELAKAIRKGPDMPPAQPVADSEPDRNPVLAYADSYRDMAKQGVEPVPIWSVITDLERNIAPLYRHAQPAPVVMDDKKLRELFDAWFASDCSFDQSPAASEADNIAWRESYWYVWRRCHGAMLQELQKSAGTEATCRGNENVQVLNTIKGPPALGSLPKTVEVQNTNSPVNDVTTGKPLTNGDSVTCKSLTCINPAPALVSLPKNAKSLTGNYPVIPDSSEHCPCCGKKLRRACSVEGCGGKHVAHGLCQKHYDMKRWEDPEQVERFREAGRRYRGKKKSTVATPQEPKP